jgi:hypothetical protein
MYNLGIENLQEEFDKKSEGFDFFKPYSSSILKIEEVLHQMKIIDTDLLSESSHSASKGSNSSDSNPHSKLD